MVRELSTNDSIEHLTELLHRAYAQLAAMGLNFTATDQSAEVTAKRIAGGQCFVAEFDQKIVGTIVVQPTYEKSDCEYFTLPGVAAVHQFGVEPSLQGTGIGRALLARCEQWAASRGFVELAMDTAEPASHLIQFYSNLGYSPVGHVQWQGKVYRSVVLSKSISLGEG